MTLLRFFEILTWRDAVDVLAVAIIIYNLLLLIRGTRAVQMLSGLFFLGLVYYAAILAELPTLQRILENLLIVLPFAIIVLFQGEIRRALADFGRNPQPGSAKRLMPNARTTAPRSRRESLPWPRPHPSRSGRRP